MKFVLVIVISLFMLGGACKLEMSSATSNSNLNASQTVNSTSAPPQETGSTCSLKMAGAPSINGLRLGMTSDEVLAVFPGSKDDPDLNAQLAKPPNALGVSDFVIHADKLQPKEKFVAINHFTFSLLDDRVSTINIGYNGPAYAHVDQFVSKFVEGTSLPPVDQWQAYIGMDNQLKILTCKDFEVRVFAGGQGGKLNYVLITDLEANKKLKNRRAKSRANASQSPTPKP